MSSQPRLPLPTHSASPRAIADDVALTSSSCVVDDVREAPLADIPEPDEKAGIGNDDIVMRMLGAFEEREKEKEGRIQGEEEQL